jgi:eukaryotic-like serine/threonine-protein kinase
MTEETLFEAALEKETLAERAAFLDEACSGDVAVRQRVDALLRSHEHAGFLKTPAVQRAEKEKSTPQSPTEAAPAILDPPASAERAGAVIGPYKLLQQVGEGGMGTVFMAEQTHPVQRKVAVKVIKAGMDSRQIVARFEAERQALAMMDHVNIARVLDAGATESGLPYFVMELVRGVPITQYCDDNHLTPRERLELFVPVCQAIQHAHQKGIIHRDIKPSNVMVTLYDDKPVPKVIDFGVAKATEQPLTAQTLFTQYGTMVGTLEYMSPEQASMSALGADTRSDIYSLGVLLYELLTGSTPLTHKRVKEAAYGEVLRLIKEEDPPKPSTRLSDSGEALVSISAQRHTQPAKLMKLMRGELDWIVMKCLEKDRDRRYETANGFVADLKRYLNDEPVKACPPSALYRVRKFARRNKRILATAGIVVLALVLGTAVSTRQAIRATAAEGLAQKRLAAESEARNATRAQLRLTEQAQEEAMHRLYEAGLAQARAGSLSRRIGQRFESLDAVAQALKIARDRNQGEERMLELRNAAIACLALPDLRIAKQWDGWPTGSFSADFDSNLERYARVDRQGVVHIHRVADQAEICNVPGLGPGDAWPWFSPDGQYLALKRLDHRFRLWKLDGAQPVAVLEESSAPGGAAFSPDSRQLAIGQANGSIRLLELPSARQVKQLEGGPSPRFLRFHPEGRQLAVCCSNGIQIFDLETGRVLADLREAPGVECIAWHPDGKTLAVGGGDRIIRIWDVANRKPIARLEGHTGGGIFFDYNHSGDLLVSACWDGALRLWDPRTGLQLFNTRASVLGLRFSPDDRFLAAEAKDTTLRILEVARSSAYGTLVGGPMVGRTVRYAGCAISPDGRLLTVTDVTGVSFWDLAKRKELAFSPTGHTSAVVFESCDALLTGGPAGLLRWPVQEDVAVPGLLRIGPPTKLLPFSGNAIGSSSDGRVIASPQGTGALVLDLDHPDRPIPLTPHADVRHTGVSPDGKWAATGSHWYTKVKIWAARTGKLVKELPIEWGSMVGFSPDGKWLATTGGPGVSLWAVGSWMPGKQVGGVLFAFAPHGPLLAVETGHGVIRLVSPDSGQEYARLEGPNQEPASRICFSPDGAQLVALAQDSQSIHVWDLRATREQLTIMGLDWSLPPYPPAPKVEDSQPLRVQVELGDQALSPRSREETARQIIEQDRRALTANPNSAAACNRLAWNYLTAPAALRDWKAALPLAQKAVQLEPGPMNRNTLGLAYYRAGRYREAIEASQANLKDQVDWVLTYDLYFLAMSHHQLGERAQARQFYDVAVRWSVAHSEALKQYAVELASIQAEAAEVLGVKENKH